MGLVLITTPSLTVSLLRLISFLFVKFFVVLTGYVDSRNTDNSTKTGVGNKGPGTASDTSGSTAMGGDSSTKAGSSEINAGPHDSKMANKMDPRVDNDQGKSKLSYW